MTSRHRPVLPVLITLLIAAQHRPAFASRHLSQQTTQRSPASAESAADDSALTAQASDWYEAKQYLHAGCAVFLDNSTVFTAMAPNSTEPTLYRGMTATVINYDAHDVVVPWTFNLSASAPGYSGIRQAYNFDDSSVVDGVVLGTATADFLTLQPKASNNITIGLLLEANAAVFPLPQSFLLNNQPCSVVILPDDIPPPANITSPPLQDVQSSAGSGLTTLNGQIIDNTLGQPITLHGFNYFGFDNAQTCVDGLYAGSTTLSRDLVTIIRTQQALGFNAVRLLTSFGTVFGLPPVPQGSSCTAATPEQYQAYLTDPATPVAAGATIPPLAYEPPTTPGLCSDYLDGFASTFDRYMFVISLFARNGFYVVLDNQLNDDPTLINQGQDVWLGYWRQIATAVAADPYAVNKVIIDGLNEPDSYGIRWEPTATRPGYGNLLLALFDALYPILPGTLFFVEGVDQQCNGAPAVNWGDGFASQPDVLALFPSCGISNPGPNFFEPLLTRPYLNQVVISPHLYGPSISGTTANDAGVGLWTRLSQSFGYLNLAGYGGHRFAIAIGEFGSNFANPADGVLFADLVRYFANRQADGSPVDALHNPITSFFWFAWNANSGDTGGLVQPLSTWDNIVWSKIEYLQTLGLAPWYTGAAPSTVVLGGTTPTSGTATPAATPAVTPVATRAPNATLPASTPAATPLRTPTATSLATPSVPGTTPVATPAITPPLFSPSATTIPGTSPLQTPAVTPTTPKPTQTTAPGTYPTPAVPVVPSTPVATHPPAAVPTQTPLEGSVITPYATAAPTGTAHPTKTPPATQATPTAVPQPASTPVAGFPNPSATPTTSQATRQPTSVPTVPSSSATPVMIPPTAPSVPTVPSSSATPVLIPPSAPSVPSVPSVPTIPAPVSTPVPIPSVSTTPFIPSPYVLPPSTTTPATPPLTPPAKDKSSSCSVTAAWSDYWLDPVNGPFLASVNLYITNIGSQTVPSPWSITISNPDYTMLQYTWNWHIQSPLNGGSVSGVADYDWETLQPGGNTITVGYVAGSGKSDKWTPAVVNINGQVCIWG